MALPLVIDIGSTDVMAALRELKEEVGTRVCLMFSSMAEAHLLATQEVSC
jgi:hypothetical protein